MAKRRNKRVVGFVNEVYPTEQAVIQKEERKSREEQLAAEGQTPEEIKKLRKRNKINQEEHYDDCG